MGASSKLDTVGLHSYESGMWFWKGCSFHFTLNIFFLHAGHTTMAHPGNFTYLAEFENLAAKQMRRLLTQCPTRCSNMWSGILYVKWKHVESLQVVSAQKLKERLCFPGLCWFNIPHGEGEVPVAGGRLQSSARSTQIPGRHRNDPRYGKFHWLLYITLNYWSGAI